MRTERESASRRYQFVPGLVWGGPTGLADRGPAVGGGRAVAVSGRDRLLAVLARLRLNPTGAVLGVLFVCLSLTPSLLPRTWLVQGIVSGVGAVIGYGFGVVAAWGWHRATSDRWRVPARWRVRLRIAVAVATLALLGLSLYYGALRQRDLHLLLGEPSARRIGYLRVLVVTLVIAAVAIAAARAVRGLVRLTITLARHRLADRPARIVGVAAVCLAGVVIANGIVRNGFLSVATFASADTNNAVASAATMPTSPTRSGSPPSFASWNSLGREGRSFVSGGPSLGQLRAFAGDSAKAPIRVYAGIQSAPTADDAAALAVRELARTDAPSRAVLCVVTTTGTGWIDPYAAAALEYLAGGDTAIVGTQYSYLPSWISFLAERERVTQTGRALFEHVYAWWSALPPAHRPRLVVFGESLGSLGSEGAFDSLDDLIARTDGALWLGPTRDNPLWSKLVAGRDRGSTEILPIYHNGHTVRFASRPQDLQRPDASWPAPRVVYLQNASDPVSWWSPRLLFTRPDWLEEPRGYDVPPTMRWYPILTGLQVTADLALAQTTRATHGHYFHGATVAGWAAILSPTGWSDARTATLTEWLDRTLG